MRLSPALLALACVAGTANAATVSGNVMMIDRDGRPTTDASDVVVYIDGVKLKSPAQKTSVSMKGKEFRPHLVVVTAGSTVEFPNEDPIFHNVFSVSGDNRFDLDLYKRPKVGSRSFEAPGIVRVYCNIHPQMSAVVVVRDNPYFARASQDGSFSIEGVPAGSYTLSAWHERAKLPSSVPITVADKGLQGIKLELDASGFKRIQHKNKFGKDYSSGEKY